MADYTVAEMMEAYAEDAVELAGRMGVELDYSEESLEAVDKILERYHREIPKGFMKLLKKGPSEEQIVQMSKVWGGYVGEVLRRHIGGEWELNQQFDNAIALTVRSGVVFPPAKVNKRILNGNEDNVHFYYQVIKTQHAGHQVLD